MRAYDGARESLGKAEQFVSHIAEVHMLFDEVYTWHLTSASLNVSYMILINEVVGRSSSFAAARAMQPAAIMSPVLSAALLDVTGNFLRPSEAGFLSRSGDEICVR